jgi:hypothetical protein
MAERNVEVACCPGCGQSLALRNSFVQEFWMATDTIYFCWCCFCKWRGEVKSVARVIGIEPAGDSDPC